MRSPAILLMLLAVVLLQPLKAEVRDVDPVDRSDTPETVLEAIDAARAAIPAPAEAAPEVRSDAYGRLGDVLFAHGFSAQAEQAYRNARELNPSVADWHYLLGMLAIDRGELNQAVAHLDQAIERNPFDPVAFIRRGQTRLDQGRPEAAAPDFERALALAPDAPAALAGQGRVLLSRGDHAAAAELFERVLEISPEATRLHQPLAMAYRALGDVERAREQIERIGSGSEPIADPLLERVQRQSRSPQFYLEVGLQRAEAGDLDEARRLLAVAVQLAPDDPVMLENYGQVVARQGDLEEAAAAFERWIGLEVDAARAHFLLGQVRELQGALKAAEQAYQSALALAGDHVEAAEALAFLELEAGEFAQAERRFSRLLGDVEQAESARFGFWAALAMLAAGDCGRGENALEELSDRFPSDGDVLAALARVRATCGAVSAEGLEEALRWAEAVYQTAPTTDNSATLAMVFAALGQFDDAVDLQAQAMFEALKSGQLEARPDLRADMERYQAGRPAGVPFAPGYPGLPNPVEAENG
ncbi:tetratricopeptide repeat protein [Wenzhouxiangella limi]|uniref:Tetratricopeptide repeat protein n=1 Tax=Wenzhouxiangella limi TaxID=2707351 RepID=A0A845V720_9GAMM|nr:tetratricopeptide repeat protein [Wenzhouxiangella limi]NDY95755.1 tetratricopeptide repeat protein [Wenzhouxiangella limi]